MKANEFEASKHQRQIVNRFNTFVQDGDTNFEKDIQSRIQAASKSTEENAAATTAAPEDTDISMESSSVKKLKPKKSKNVATDLKTRIHSSEYLVSEDKTVDWKHRFKVRKTYKDTV
jgi:superoxide dismutase